MLEETSKTIIKEFEEMINAINQTAVILDELKNDKLEKLKDKVLETVNDEKKDLNIKSVEDIYSEIEYQLKKRDKLSVILNELSDLLLNVSSARNALSDEINSYYGNLQISNNSEITKLVEEKYLKLTDEFDLKITRLRIKNINSLVIGISDFILEEEKFIHENIKMYRELLTDLEEKVE